MKSENAQFLWIRLIIYCYTKIQPKENDSKLITTKIAATVNGAGKTILDVLKPPQLKNIKKKTT